MERVHNSEKETNDRVETISMKKPSSYRRTAFNSIFIDRREITSKDVKLLNEIFNTTGIRRGVFFARAVKNEIHRMAEELGLK